MRKRRKRKQDDKMDDSWLLPYSDMLTLLLALFIVLYASSEIDEQRFLDLRNVFHEQLAASGSTGIIDGGEGVGQYPTEPPEQDTADTEKENQDQSKEEMEEKSEEPFSAVQHQEFLQMKQQINDYIKEHDLEDQLSIQLTDEGLLLTIVNDVLFDSGSAEVKKKGHATANEIARILNTDPPHQVVISGHADDVPISYSNYTSNWDLSVERALNFMTLIVENTDLDPSLFSVKGHGDTKPLFPNDSLENRAKNRRVEVLILPNVELNEKEE